MEFLTPIAVILFAYLLGAVPFGLLVARAFGVRDIRTLGSGNIGATNVMRVLGPKAAVWVYLLDIAKGVAAVLMARYLEQTMLPTDIFRVVVGLSAVIGHVFPVYLGFKGGKGVNTAFGVVMTLLPFQSLIAFGVFVIAVAISRFISLGSILAATVLFAAVLIQKLVLHQEVAAIYLWLTLVLALLVFYTHRSNIGRLLAGTESRFSLSSKAGKAGSRG